MDPYKPNSLGSLATELILMVGKSLSLGDVRSLAKCNRRFYMLFQDTVLRTVYCHICKEFHEYKGDGFGLSGPVSQSTSQLPCAHSCHAKLRCLQLPNIRSEYVFYHVQLKSAMKRFHVGHKCGITTQSLSYKEVTQYSGWTTDPTFGKHTLFSVEAMICGNPPSLHLRAQTIILYRRDQGAETFPSKICMKLWRDTLSFGWKDLNSMVTPAEEHYTDQTIRQFCVEETTLRKINCECSIDHELRVHNLAGGARAAFVITKWLDLGEGQFQTDRRWTQNCTNRWYQNFGQSRAASPRATFENACPEDNSALKAGLRSVACLRDQSYQCWQRVIVSSGTHFNGWVQ